ncbi:methyltransferase domain-containing protein [Maridesulfovibrio hydrothermalis]|uniref:Methyltransferase type 11 n=1 Tax=Maridesulfovibrio hydrothermalis AM13 = DSM 14728 TaxID=1121451 RepID=L0RE72_9BACT|nr:methyltransferase domain-containing protein [Maridesulfovibrio hydrothermalis]CCO25093.1 Methyltransferase type 11 [Maridesulfovibrio hydrothermalis AM13 = DSM 14728]
MKKRIRQCFSKAAASYSDAAAVQRDVAARCAALCPCGRYDNVLDIGSGVGFLHGELEQRIEFVKYISLDLVHPMLLEQRKVNKALLVTADGENLPLRDGTFDLLASSSAMQWYSDPQKSIPESFKVLKHGGKFSIAVFIKGTLGELADVSLKTGFGSVKELKDGAFYKDIFSNISGLSVDFVLEKHEVYFSSVKDFLRKHKMTGAVASSGSISWGKEKYLRFVEEYEKLYRGDAGIRATYEVLLAYGEKS